MIYEASCDTEVCSNEKPTDIKIINKLHFKIYTIQIENISCKNTSPYYSVAVYLNT